MAQSRHRNGAAQELAATNPRNFRTFLLMQQFAAQEIGARIRQARKERGLTQDQLADLVTGFSKRSLQDYESGKTIPYAHLTELGVILRRTTEWFLYGDEPEEEPPSYEQLRKIVRDEFRAVLESLGRIERATGADESDGQTG
jgi:transcriptional regulator with XRE-family HTH domain